jgi:hypothetical protein
MTKERRVVERRKHKRFHVPIDACVALKSDCIEVGQVIDIGKGGLAFRYMPRQERSNGSIELDIFLADRRFCLSKVPFQAVSELETHEIDVGPSIKRCGVKFGELTHRQISHLEYFIQNQTTGEV